MNQVKNILDELIYSYPQLGRNKEDIWNAYCTLETCYENSGRLFVCGNGGSAADALHIVGELMKSFVIDRQIDKNTANKILACFPDQAAYMVKNIQGALPAYALVENVALATAYANDVEPDMNYAQQLYGYAQKGDVLIAISTSGNAINVLNAVRLAKAMGVSSIALTGGSGGGLKTLCDVSIVIPDDRTYKIQELHLPVYHTLCRMVEYRFFANQEGI